MTRSMYIDFMVSLIFLYIITATSTNTPTDTPTTPTSSIGCTFSLNTNGPWSPQPSYTSCPSCEAACNSSPLCNYYEYLPSVLSLPYNVACPTPGQNYMHIIFPIIFFLPLAPTSEAPTTPTSSIGCSFSLNTNGPWSSQPSYTSCPSCEAACNIAPACNYYEYLPSVSSLPYNVACPTPGFYFIFH